MASFTLITERDESQRAFDTLGRAFSRGASVFRQHRVGWQGGSGTFDVFWHPDLEVWGLFEREPPRKKQPGRFWNCFGIADPGTSSMLNITLEINPPHVGENARMAGVFLRDETGRAFIGHTGKIGGGRLGIGQRAFQNFLKDGEWHEIESSRRQRRSVVVFGPLSREDLAPVIAPYVHAVARFKNATSHPI